MAPVNLSLVEQPSRYIGGEIGSRLKNPAEVAVHMALIFPDLYEIGMSSAGYQLLYFIANARQDTFCERVFTPWPDYIAELRNCGEVLRSLETKTPLDRFDILLFSVQYELACTNVLATLDLAGLPRRATDRSEHHPLLIAGGYGSFNPEPLAPFFDAFVVGDGEDVLHEILDAAARTKKAPRTQRLAAISEIKGVLVPADYTPRYREDRFAGFDVKLGVTPAVRRVVADLERVAHVTAPILPNTRLVHDRLTVEIMRGCTRGCRFCQPGFITRPLRERNPYSLLQDVRNGLAETGHDEVTLLSLSSGDYSLLPELLSALEEERRTRTFSVSLPSLRAESITEGMMAHVMKVRRGGLTIAPEAGTERLRRVLNKPITDEQILTACATGKKHGLNLVKLYFMIGLPTETDEDIKGITDLCFRALSILRQGRGGAQVNVNIGTFVPKPFTPFAWVPQLTLTEARARADELRNASRGSRVVIKMHDPAMSYIEGILARGDRRIAEVIAKAVDLGSYFDGWTDHFSLPRWLAAFEACGLDPDRFVEGFGENDPLPWDGVDALLDKEFLISEWRNAKNGILTEDCRSGPCASCGSCDFDDIVNRMAALEESKPVPTDLSPAPAPGSYRYRVRYGKIGDMRFIGHLEFALMIHRALFRAEFPVAYSQGFHRKPKVAFGPPLSVGMESLEESFDVVLTSLVDTDEIQNRLSGVLPPEVPIQGVTHINLKAPSLSDSVRALIFEADLSALKGGRFEEHEKIRAMVEAFTAATEWPITVTRKNQPLSIDAKEFLKELAVSSEWVLRLTLAVTQKGGLNPAKAVNAVFGLDEKEGKAVRYKKVSAVYESGPIG